MQLYIGTFSGAHRRRRRRTSFNILAGKSMKHERNVDEESQRDQNNQRNNGGIGIETPTGQSPKLDLNQIHQSHHQKPAPEHRSESGHHHPQPQRHLIHMPEMVLKTLSSSAAAGTAGFADLDRLLQRQGDEAGEKERAEGVHVKGYEALGDVGSGGAGFGGSD